uniref:Reverse transcriptase domain-containing protein n=1 Tax=Tanacetum cinerariifolium TaxID=118510 RepID=A0A699H3K4_TANCI|nr:hypothetical protein [Tanacetum cinerariifolium]
MRTRSLSNLPVVSPSKPSLTSNPKCRNCRRSKQPFILDETPIDTMVDQRTMTELLCAPTEGYAEAIVVPSILAEQFELKHSLINMMTSDQFFGLENDNPHDHIRWFNKITSTIKYKDVPISAIKLMLFPFSLAGAARRWLEKEPPHSLHTWEDPRFDESFHEAWERYKDLLRVCPHHGFSELHKLDTFYNVLNPVDQDSLNAAAGGNLLERRTQDVFTVIENKYKVRNSRNKSVVSQIKSCDANSNSSSEIAKLTHAVNQQTSAVTTAMTAILKQFQATVPPAFIKVVEKICVTCSGAHPYYQCLTVGGNTFLELQDNIQGYVSTAAVNYNQGNSIYRPPEGGNVLPKKLLDLDSTEDLHSSVHVNPLSGSTTYSSSPNQLLEELADELALITYPPKYDDDLQFDVEFDLKEIEFLLHQDIDSSLKDSINQSNLANPADNFVDSMPKIFTDEHALDYSSPPIFDEYDDDFLEVESDAENVYDDPFDSKGEKIKASKLLIDELDLPCESEYDSFTSEDFSRVDAKPSTNNEDKIFNPCILI